jgi:catechol 2,3-dioxygenase-like lactoylglutathione lyase family enzyme
MDSYPTFIGRNFDQVCFVVDDLDKAVDYWRRVNGVKTWDIVEGLSRPQVEKEIWGKPGNFEFSCAYGVAGKTLIELARHDGGESVYAGWTGGPHHIGFRLEDAEQFKEAAAHYESQGIERAMSALFNGASSACRWAYYDTRAMIGCYTEIYYVDGDGKKRFEDFASGRSDRLILARS